MYARTVSSNARPTYPVVMPIVTPLDWRTEYECPPEAPEPPYGRHAHLLCNVVLSSRNLVSRQI